MPGRENKSIDTGVKLIREDGTEEPVFIKRAAIASYFTPEFWWLYECYMKTKTHGLPNGAAGWANEPDDIMSALFTLEWEDNAIEAERFEKPDERSGGPSH